jgi:hypothetical protein
MMLFLCWIQHEITSGQIQDSKQKDVKNQPVLTTAAAAAATEAAPVKEIMDTPS